MRVEMKTEKALTAFPGVQPGKLQYKAQDVILWPNRQTGRDRDRQRDRLFVCWLVA